MKKFMMILAVTGIMVGCSSPQKVVLNNGQVIETKDEVDYNRKTGFYEFEDEDGNENSVNASEVTTIEEM